MSNSKIIPTGKPSPSQMPTPKTDGGQQKSQVPAFKNPPPPPPKPSSK